MRIEMIYGTNVNGKLVSPGDIIDVNDRDAALLIGQGQAKQYVAPPEKPKIEEKPKIKK